MAKTTMTTLSEKKFGKFGTLTDKVQDWVEKNNNTRRVLRARYTVTPGNYRNDYRRAINIIHTEKS